MRNYAVYVLLRQEQIIEPVTTEPCETGWATEAIFFLTVHKKHQSTSAIVARSQISADGINWIDNDSPPLIITDTGTYAMKLRDFGGWLRLTIKGSEGSLGCVITSQLSLKE
ncbi:MAG: hypothetical protein M0R76_13845 [Proteobacteria bacterium]|nr:hypothetical protein [Pseudomonadota bacterium]